MEDYEHNKLEEKFKNSDMESLVINSLEIVLKTGKFAEKASINEIIALKKDIFEAADKYDIRKNNNHLKHRGMFNFEGLDDVNTFAYEKYGLMVDVIDVTSGDKTHCEPQRMMYEEYRNLKNEISKLQDFSEIFEDKFDQLINLVIPKSYVKPVGDIKDLLSTFIPGFDDLVFPGN